MPSLSDIFSGNQISAFLSGQQNNPAYQQAQLQLANQPLLNQAAWNSYNQMLAGPVPGQSVAGMDVNRTQGLQNIIGAVPNLQNLATQGAGTLSGIQSGAGAGTQTLQGIASGGISPEFGQNVAQNYMNFLAPQLQSAQQGLANQANMAWNKGVGQIGGLGEGFMSSGRNSALGQAQENAMTNLASQQQQLAFNAAQQAAQAGQQAGNQQYAGRLAAGGTLGQQGLAGAGLTGQLQQAGITPGQAQAAAGEQFQNQQQAQLNANYNNAIAQFQNPFRSLQNLQAGLGTLGSTTGALNAPMPNNTMMLMNLLGQGMNGTGILGPLLKTLGGGASGLLGNLGGLLGGGANSSIPELAMGAGNITPEALAQALGMPQGVNLLPSVGTGLDIPELAMGAGSDLASEAMNVWDAFW